MQVGPLGSTPKRCIAACVHPVANWNSSSSLVAIWLGGSTNDTESPCAKHSASDLAERNMQHTCTILWDVFERNCSICEVALDLSQHVRCISS